MCVEEMARQTSVHPRTIRRDLSLFVEAGIPLRETVHRRNKKVWRIEQQSVRLLTVDTVHECLALLVAEALFQPMQGSEFLNAIARCRSKLTSNLRPNVRKLLEEQVAEMQRDRNNAIPWALAGDVVESMWARLAVTCNTAQHAVGGVNRYSLPRVVRPREARASKA